MTLNILQTVCLHQALIDEDRLLSRLEVMGNQLQAYSKVHSVHSCKTGSFPANGLKSSLNIFTRLCFPQSQTEEGIRKELLALQEDKHNYETSSKDLLRKLMQEKVEVFRKLSEVEVRHKHTLYDMICQFSVL